MDDLAEYHKWHNGRRKLSEFLRFKMERVRSTHWSANICRLLGSNLDSCFNLAGVLLDNFQRESWADSAFMLSFSSGLICLAVTLIEILYSHGVDEELIDAIKQDEQNYEELRNSLLRVQDDRLDVEFPKFDRIASTLIDLPEEEESVFSINPQLLINGQLFTLLPKFLLLASKYPITLDVARIQLQLHTHPKNYLGILSLSVRDLPEEQQRISSVPVSGRILLNSMTSFKSWCHLRGEFVPKQYKKLSAIEESMEYHTESIKQCSLNGAVAFN